MIRLARLSLVTLLALAAPLSAAEPAALDIARSLEAAFVQVAEGARAGVVTLTVSSTLADTPLPETAEELEEYLREHMPDLRHSAGIGSGFIVDDAGTIYTNAHVVAGASSVEVIFSDGRRAKADVVGFDRGSDVAVVRLVDPPADLKPLALGDSDRVRVGQFAFAMGSPLGLEGSFTVGHVSALHRREVGQTPGGGNRDFDALRYQDFIQVDAPINPGNSGGPLLDLEGRVIGINTAIYDGGGGGIAFSIPINMADGIAGQLANDGRVRRGYLGVSMSELDPDLAEMYGLDRAASVIIKKVEKGSPAEKGLFLEEDIVLEFAGESIRSPNDLVHAIANAPIGEEIDAIVFRTTGDGQEVALKVVLVEQEDRTPDAEKVRRPDRTDLGDLGLELGGARKGGVLIEDVQIGSLADQAGLEAGDVLLQVGQDPVTSSRAALEAIRDSSRTMVPLRYLRGGDEKVTAIERPRR